MSNSLDSGIAYSPTSPTVIQDAKSHSEIHFDVIWLQYDIFAYHYTANVFGVKFTDFSRDPVSAVLQ